MRWRCPPENSCGNRFDVLGVEPDELHQLLDPVDLVAACSMPWMRIGSPMIDPHRHARVERRVRILEDDLDLAAAARAARRAFIVEHLVAAEPHRARRRVEQPQHQRPVVVLPQPDSPTSPSVCPGRTEKLTPDTALHRRRSRAGRTGRGSGTP